LAGTAAIKMPTNKRPKKMQERFIFPSASGGQDNAADMVSPTILIDGLWNLSGIIPFWRQ
jgi:hypothetical protein